MQQPGPSPAAAWIRRAGLALLLNVCLFTGGALTAWTAHAQVATTTTITTCDEATLGSAIVHAASGDTLTFGCSGDITLTNTLSINKNLTLDGSGQHVTLDGNNHVQVLSVIGHSFTLNALTIARGEVVGADGGGLFNNHGTVTISNSTFANNSANSDVNGVGGNGGGLGNTGGMVTITNSTFTGNTTGPGVSGGGLETFGGTVSIKNSTFAHNSAASGGGLVSTGSGTVLINDSTFANNSAFAGSGGALINAASTVAIGTSTFANNSVSGTNSVGGGIGNSGTMSISNSTIANNSNLGIGSGSVGGGLYNSGMVTIDSSTIAYNAALNGAGLFISNGTVTIDSSIVANNSGNNCTGSISNDRGYNLSSDHSCSFTHQGDQQNVDPKLASALASNGGPTQTLALQAGSPAIDVIPLQGTSFCQLTDQRGQFRADNGESTCDIGAYEFVDPADKDLALTNMPANITTNATSAQGAVVTYTAPTATDEGGETPTVQCTPASGSTFAVGTTTVTCTATDSDDTPSTVSASFTVTVTDTDLALTNVPANITTSATSAQGAVVTYTPPTATDEDGSSPAVSCTPASGSTFAVGTTTVTCTATDSDDSNSPVTASFTITVQPLDNDLALTNVPANITVAATSGQGAIVTYAAPTATDEGGETPAVQCTPASGSAFAIGTTTVTCSASDSDDTPSTVSASFTVTVTDADLALTNVPANITTNATSAQGAVVTYMAPTATDEGGETPSVSCTSTSGSTFAIGTTSVTCTASDSDDTPRMVSSSFTVIVVDKLPPSLQLPASPLTVDATSPQGATVNYTVTATDPVYPANQLTISCTPASGSTFALGSTTVNCRVSDPAGNTASGSFTVHVNGAATQISNLITTVNSFHLQKGIQTSLNLELQVAQAALAHNQPKLACLALKVFSVEVTKLTGHGITSSQAAQLLASSKQIQAVLGC